MEAGRFLMRAWKPYSLHGPDLKPVPFHMGQRLCADSRKRYVVMAAGTQGGKDLSLDTLVSTPNGMIPIGNVHVGDSVHTRDGTVTKVIYESPTFTDNKCYKITFDDGTTVVAGAEHQWMVRNATTGDNLTGEITVQTQELYDRHLSGIRWEIDTTAPIKGNENIDLPIHPYVLGIWLGQRNGNDSEDMSDILKEEIYSLGISRNKHIPEMYFLAGVSYRRSLLAGILDRYARVNKRGEVSVETTNEKLAGDIARLACSLSAKASIAMSPIRRLFRREKIGMLYKVIIQSSIPIAYKQYSEHYPYRPEETSYRRKIVDIEKHPTVPTKCISVEDESRSYLITNAYIPTHNTSYGPHWLFDEIYSESHGRGSGDYLAVTATYDLFKLKMHPTMMEVFDGIHDMARYWAGIRVIELRDPITGQFWAKNADDPMWGRIILRSADALAGLESSTAKAAWLDEVGQDAFTVSAYHAIRRRLALNRGRILMTTTLYTYNWFLTRMVKPILATGETKFINDPLGDIDYTESDEMNASLVQFDSTVNPLFTKEEYAEAQNTLSEEEFSMFYRGRETTRRFLIYNNFNPEKHTTKRFHIPENWARYVGVDFGGTHMAAMFYAEEPETKRLYAYKEYLAGNKTIKQHVADMLSEEPVIPLCYGGAKGEGQWRAEFSQAGLHINQPVVEDVDIGISRVYAQHANDGIIYFDDLSHIIEEKGTYRHKRNSDGTYSDEIVSKNTYHMLDAERYIISAIRQMDDMRMKIKRISFRR